MRNCNKYVTLTSEKCDRIKILLLAIMIFGVISCKALEVKRDVTPQHSLAKKVSTASYSQEGKNNISGGHEPLPHSQLKQTTDKQYQAGSRKHTGVLYLVGNKVFHIHDFMQIGFIVIGFIVLFWGFVHGSPAFMLGFGMMVYGAFTSFWFKETTFDYYDKVGLAGGDKAAVKMIKKGYLFASDHHVYDIHGKKLSKNQVQEISKEAIEGK